MQVMKLHLKECQKKPGVDLVLSHICFADLTIIVTRQKTVTVDNICSFCDVLFVFSWQVYTLGDYSVSSDHHFRVILEISWHFQTMPIDYDPTLPDHLNPVIDQDQFDIAISGQFCTILMFSPEIKLYIISIFVTIQEPSTKL